MTPLRGALPKGLQAMALSLAVIAMGGCIIPVIYVAKQMMSEKAYTVTMQADEDADSVYARLVQVVLQRNPDWEVIENDAAKREFEAKGLATTGEEVWVAWKVTPTRAGCELTVSAQVGEQSGEEVQQVVRERIQEIFAGRDIEWT